MDKEGLVTTQTYKDAAKAQLFIFLSVVFSVITAGVALLFDRKVSTFLYLTSVGTVCFLGIAGYYLAETCKRLARL